MAIDPTAFERYRRSPNEKTTFWRLVIGTIVIAACWFGATLGIIFGSAWVLPQLGEDFSALDPMQMMLGSPFGLFITLFTFSGIWIGAWIAMRVVHKEKLAALFGNSRLIARSAFCKGLIAVLLTSLLTEAAYFAIMPDIVRGPISFGLWALLLIPIALGAFIQTSSEELLFRGYLQRGLANRFRSAIVWGVLPTIAFTALHWNPSSVLAMNIGVVISIGAFAALLALLVYRTGNLGAAMGAHLGNNFVGFALISHDQTLGGLALFQAPPLDSLAWTPAETATVAGISVLSILATWLMLLHPSSPLKVEPDLG